MLDFTKAIDERLHVPLAEISDTTGMYVPNIMDLEGEDDEFIEEFRRIISDDSILDADDEVKSGAEDAARLLPAGSETSATPDAYDPYLRMEIGLPRGGDNALHHARVKRRKVDDEGEPIRTSNSNPRMDSRQYEVEYLDGTLETLTANTIAENMLSQVDEEGHKQQLIDEVMDHRWNKSAVKTDDAYFTTRIGQKRRKLTTKGWELCVLWKDGSTD